MFLRNRSFVSLGGYDLVFMCLQGGYALSEGLQRFRLPVLIAHRVRRAKPTSCNTIVGNDNKTAKPSLLVSRTAAPA